MHTVYQITNTANGKRYIGSSFDYRTRFKQHMAYLRYGRHHNAEMQADWNEYGPEVFVLAVLEQVPGIPSAISMHPRLLMAEKRLIDKLQPEYNVAWTPKFAPNGKSSPIVFDGACPHCQGLVRVQTRDGRLEWLRLA